MCAALLWSVGAAGFGVEASLTDVPNVELDAWLQECISEVDTALLESGCTSDRSLVIEHSGSDSSCSSSTGCGEGLESRSSRAGLASLGGTSSGFMAADMWLPIRPQSRALPWGLESRTGWSCLGEGLPETHTRRPCL